MNEDIREKEIRLITENGDNVGVVSIREALDRAETVGLDLIEISPNANPPVCKILDFGKFKYEEQKRKHEAKKKQKVVNVKELKIRPMIGDHDYDVKIKQATKFLNSGDKVKFTLRFKGREAANMGAAFELMNKVKDDLELVAKVDANPKMEGRQMMMLLSPLK